MERWRDLDAAMCARGWLTEGVGFTADADERRLFARYTHGRRPV